MLGKRDRILAGMRRPRANAMTAPSTADGHTRRKPYGNPKRAPEATTSMPKPGNGRVPEAIKKRQKITGPAMPKDVMCVDNEPSTSALSATMPGAEHLCSQ